METRHIDKKEFLTKVWDFENSPRTWEFKGERPVIIDFFAQWCGPCKMLAPVLDSLSEKYQGIVDIYKVDTEEEMELSNVFRIRSVPSILFIPKEGTPTMVQGYMPEVTMENLIKDKLL